ncbi:MAG: plasmid stabilization protein [Flavobacteriaceae bacterium]|nr:MAG: plasmid stabilization protein [Flavobacteriaceae bacterium]
MEVLYLNSFKKDIKKLRNKKLKTALKAALIDLENSEDLFNFKNLKKIKGHTNYYRIKIDGFRLGIYCLNGTIQVCRFVKRNDIYKVFR